MIEASSTAPNDFHPPLVKLTWVMLKFIPANMMQTTAPAINPVQNKSPKYFMVDF